MAKNTAPDIAEAEAALQAARQVPEWYRNISSDFAAAVAHAFIVAGDLGGYTLAAASGGMGGLVCFRNIEYLKAALAARDEVVVVTYSRARGIDFVSPVMRDLALKWMGVAEAAPASADPLAALRRPLGNVPAGDIFTQASNPLAALRLIDQLMRQPAARDRVAVVIEYAELLAPDQPKGSMGEADRDVLATLLGWGGDHELGTMQGAAIFLTTARLAELHPDLRAAGSMYRAVEIPLPDRTQRLAYLYWYQGERRERDNPLPPITLQDVTLTELANTTAGLSLRHIEDILLRGDRAGGVTRLDVKRRKDEIIASEFTDLAESVEPLPGGFADVAGKDAAKAWLCDNIIEPVRTGRRDRVPKSVLFVGPPGTGKTWLVRGLVKELGFNAVALRAEKILDQYVGQSERRLAAFFGFVRALAPCLVWIDEIDQTDLASRGGESGNPVAKNLFSQMLQFIGDETLRGQVIFVFATNRPDLLDTALMRTGRIDAKYPILLPDAGERTAMLQVQARFAQTRVAPDAAELITARTEGWSGSDLQALISKARQIADRRGAGSITTAIAKAALDYLRPDISQARYYTLLALQVCNDLEFLPADLQALLSDRAKLAQELAEAPQPGEPRRRPRREL